MTDLLQSAVAQHRAGRLEEAAVLYRRLLQEQPEDGDALRLLGLLSHQTGESAAGERLIRQALALDPTNTKALDNLAVVLLADGQAAVAEAALREAIALDPHHATAHFNLGKLLARSDRLAAACDSFEAAIAISPEDDSPRIQLIEVALKLGQPARALAQIDSLITEGRRLVQALSLKAIALSELGRLDDLAALVDLEGGVRTARLAAHPGFASREDLNLALAETVANHPTLRADKTTVGGQDTYELFGAEAAPCLSVLEGFIKEQVQQRIEALPEGASQDPFAALRPADYRIQSWGVKMWQQGYQVPHVHYKAWLSGVYYAQLPAVVRDPAAGQQGWIEFGKANEIFYPLSEPPLRQIQPEEGKIITFPSFYWHRTLPFAADDQRISIAFDVIPA